MVTAVAVLRQGGEYRPEHAEALSRQLHRYLPGIPRALLTDLPDVSGVGVWDWCWKLTHDYPGWWSKMELFSPMRHHAGDFLYLDLDTLLVRECAAVEAQCRGDSPIVLRDFYHRNLPARQYRMGSGFMYLPAAVRPGVWARWRDAPPERAMHRCRSAGDQGFLMECWAGPSVRYWQDLLPPLTIASAKVDVFPAQRLSSATAVVCFHGKPRPWEMSVQDKMLFGMK